MKTISSSEGNVWKHVFKKENAIYEAVSYRYGSFENRTVICCSVQSGCKVGCVFCGTGSCFIRDLSSKEIINQIDKIVKFHNIDVEKCGKLQFMFMSMGEPMHNMKELGLALFTLNKKYPNAQLLVSTVGINDSGAFEHIVNISFLLKKVGLQFSVHASNDKERDKIIPYKEKMSLLQIRNYGLYWAKRTGRKVFLNYCVNGTNCFDKNFKELTTLFDPYNFSFTFSVICSKDQNMKEQGYKNLEVINNFSKRFAELGYNVRIFDPAGQDDIGGGCGMLWHVQEHLKKLQEV